MKKLIFLLLFIPLQLFATKHYVAVGGGGAGTLISPFATIAQVNAHSFSPDDTIAFNKGDSWREILTIPSSGTSGHYVVFTSYGTGANPKIYGSKVATGWTNYSGNIWVSNSTFINPRSSFACDIFFNELNASVSWGFYKANVGLLGAEHDWTWAGNYIYIYAATNPDARYSGIEIPQRQTCIDLNNKEYLEIIGIDLFYGIFEGITYNWNYPMLDLSGLIVENCEIGYIGGNINNSNYEDGYGIDVAYSDMVVRNCEIHHCARRGISFHLYGSGFTVKNVLIEQNRFHDGHHTTGVDISVGSGSYTGSFDGIIIRRNLFFDPPTTSANSNQIFLQNDKYSTLNTFVKNIFIYSNIFKYPPSASINMEGCQSIFIYNNTFYNHNTTKSGNVAHVWVDANNTSVKVKNNIFYTELSNDGNSNGVEVLVITDYAKVEADYNLYYKINNSLRIIEIESISTKYYMNDILTIRSDLGWETNSPTPADPNFENADSLYLNVGSPAIAGIDMGLVTDIYGNAIGAIPVIGAVSVYGSVQAPADLPEVTTDAITLLKSISAIFNGTSIGATDRGFCWSTSINPSLSDTHAHVGTGEGSFSYTASLTSNTTYHVRSFATNSEGTVYGADVSFTTRKYSSVTNSSGKIYYMLVGGKKVPLIEK